MSRVTRHRLAVLGAAVLFSTGGAAIKGSALSGWQVAGLRSLVAAVALAVLVPAARRGPEEGRAARRTAAVALAYAGTVVLFALANKLTTAANAIFLQSTAPIYLLVLAPRWLGERITRRDAYVMAAIALGMCLFFLERGAPTRTAPSPWLGNLLAAASGLAWALTLLGLRWLADAPNADGRGPMRAVLLGNVAAVVLSLSWMFPLEAGARDVALLLYLGIFQIGVAYRLLSFGLRRVGAFETSLLVLVEPALNPTWAWLVHDERPGALALVGGVTILAAATVKSWLDQRRPLVRAT